MDKPTNVIQALAAVMRDLPGIGKDQRAAKEQGGYLYRGIEAVTREAQKLLGQYCVVFVPRVVDSRVEPVTVGGKQWSDTFLTVEYTVYGPGGVDDRITAGPVVGVGRDGTDKGANKAMTQALKYVLIQTLCIGDSQADVEHAAAQEADPQTGELPAPAPADPDKLWHLQARLRSLPDVERKELQDWWAKKKFPPAARLSETQLPFVNDELHNKIARACARTGTEGEAWKPRDALGDVEEAVGRVVGGLLSPTIYEAPQAAERPATPQSTQPPPRAASDPLAGTDGPLLPDGITDEMLQTPPGHLPPDEAALIAEAYADERVEQIMARLEWLANQDAAPKAKRSAKA